MMEEREEGEKTEGKRREMRKIKGDWKRGMDGRREDCKEGEEVDCLLAACYMIRS